VEEGVLVETDVDEHGLEALLDVADATFEDAVDDAGGADALDVVFFDGSVVEEGDAVLEFFAVDDEADAGLDVFFTREELADALNESEGQVLVVGRLLEGGRG
jgi:hypothetical protein